MFSKFTKGGKAPAKAAAKPVKAAKKAVKKVVPAAKKAVPATIKRSVSGTKGWLGGEGGAQNLDKWYGECSPHPRSCRYLSG